MPRYADEGRLVVAFRDVGHGSSTNDRFVAWLGRYEAIVESRDGQYRLQLLEHRGRSGNCGYPGLEILPEATFVATTYAVHKPGK